MEFRVTFQCTAIVTCLVLIVTLSTIMIVTLLNKDYPPPWTAKDAMPGVTSSISSSQANNQWFKDGVELINHNLRVKPNTKTAKNVIFFLGDGMSISTVTAARILEGQLRNQTGEENFLSWEKFPWSALSKTYNTNLQVADSAGTATAYLCGVKTNGGIIGVDQTVRRGYCGSMTEQSKVKSILTLAEEAGMSTGLVTTTRVTHATPSALYAHSPDRNWESDYDVTKRAKDNATNCQDIAKQLIEYKYGDGLEVILGGGRREFTPITEPDPEDKYETGDRRDGKNLIKTWLEKNPNSEYVWNKTAFDNIDVSKVDHLMGLFESSSMLYEVDRVAEDVAGEPSVEEMTEKAIKMLQKNPKGYFLLVEGARIDHGLHDGNAHKALTDTIAMAKAVSKALSLTNNEETLIVVTADHSHTMTISGYPGRGNPIFGIVVDEFGKVTLAKDNLPYTTLGFANGPGGRLNETRQNLTGVDTGDKEYLQQANVKKSSEAHGGDDVGIYADGPGAYLFHGVVEQQYIFHVMDHALCLSESKQSSCDQHVDRKPAQTKSEGNGNYPASLFLNVFLIVVAVLGV